MSYIEKKIDLLVESAKAYCGTELTDFDLRHEIALDVLETFGRVFSRRDPALLKKMGALLSIMPLIKKDAEGLFRQKIVEMEDACLAIQIKLQGASPLI